MPYPITVVTSSFEDILNIPLTVIRNQGWFPTFWLTDEANNLLDLTGYQILIVITPVDDSGNIGQAILTETNFVIDETGAAAFTVSGTSTGQLAAEGSYRWFLEESRPGSTNLSVVLAGPLTVSDSPLPAP
jgi:hypothetical protein